MESDAQLARRLQEEEEKAMSASYRSTVYDKLIIDFNPIL